MKNPISIDSNPHITYLVAGILFILCYFYNVTQYEFTDTAYFGGDTWYYQSIAVNVSSGEGYRVGALRDFSDYMYDPIPVGPGLKKKYQDLKGYFLNVNRADFYGSPGFPLYMAVIYKAVGVRPAVVKYTNLLLVALTAGLIPVISSRMWRRHGLASGTIAGLYFVYYLAPDPSELLGEPLIMFLLAGWGILFAYAERRISITRIVVLGVWTAVLILVKSYAMLVFLTAAFIVLKHQSRRTGMAIGALYISIVAGLILPWSIYATHHSDRVVIISTQFDNLVMDGNNEDAIVTGKWSPAWRKQNSGSPKYIYNRLSDRNLTTIEKVGRFYYDNWVQLPGFFVRKIQAAVGKEASVTWIMWIFITFYLIGLGNNYRMRRTGIPGNIQLPLFPLFCFVIWFTNTVIAFGLPRYTAIFLTFMLITVVHAPLELWNLRHRNQRHLPD